MKENNALQTAAPVMETVVFPLPHKGNRKACVEAIQKAEAAVELARAQIACVDFAQFMEDNPDIERVSFGGSWESDDEGGSIFYMDAEIEFKKGISKVEDGGADEEACDIFDHWAERMDGQVLDRKAGVAKIGRLLMGKGYPHWVAAVERMQLDQSVQSATCEGDAARL